MPRHAKPACSTIATSTLITISSVGQFLQRSTHTQFRWKSRSPDMIPSQNIVLLSLESFFSFTLPVNCHFHEGSFITMLKSKLLYLQEKKYILAGRGDPGLATQEGRWDRGRGGRKASRVATTHKILGHAHSRTDSVTNSSSPLRKAGVECILQPQSISPA